MNYIKKNSYLIMSIINLMLAIVLFMTQRGTEHGSIGMVFGVIVMFHAGYFMSYFMVWFQLGLFPDDFWIKRIYLRFAKLFAYIFIGIGIVLIPILIMSSIFDLEGRKYAWALLASPYSFIYGGLKLKRYLNLKIQMK